MAADAAHGPVTDAVLSSEGYPSDGLVSSPDGPDNLDGRQNASVRRVSLGNVCAPLLHLRALADASAGRMEANLGLVPCQGDMHRVHAVCRAAAAEREEARRLADRLGGQGERGRGQQHVSPQAAREAASAKATLRKMERLKSAADEDQADAEKALEKAKSVEAKAGDSLESTDAGEKGNGLLLSIMTALENADSEMTTGVIKHRVPGGKKMGDASIQAGLDYLVEHGRIKVDRRKGGNGRTFSYYSIA